jgi:alpha-1,2-mannosyltransferase
VSEHVTDHPGATRRVLPRLTLPTGLLWLGVLVIVPLLAQQRYASIPHRVSVGWDYRIFYHAAWQLLHGRNPYVIPGYTYTPLLALVMTPLASMGILWAWKAWIVVELIAVVLGVAVFVITEARGRPAWQSPVLFAFGFVTAMWFFPLTRIMRLGQVDFFVVLLILLSVWSQSRGRSAIRGVFLGLATLLKVWPVFDAVVLLQRGLADRRRAIVAFVVVVCTTPFLILAFGGLRGARMFVTSTSNERSYHLVSHSLWGTAALMFSNTGLAQPLYVSNPVRIAMICVLVPVVIGLMFLTLRTPGDAALCMWNIAGCLILVIPMVHLAYSVYVLPLLWVWGARLLGGIYRSREAWAVFGVLVVWWLLQTHSWPDDHFSPRISAWHYSVVFWLNLAACTASVLGNWMIQRRIALADPTPESGSGTGAMPPAMVDSTP